MSKGTKLIVKKSHRKKIYTELALGNTKSISDGTTINKEG